MFLKELHIENYKNLPSLRVDFTHKFNFFTGLNGAGKTNLLDSIHYLSFGRSYFHRTDSFNIRHNEEYFLIKGFFNKSSKYFQLYCAYKKNHRKVIKKNDIEYDRLADHIGEFPVVMITPYDIDLISGGSEERRKFLDVIMSQLDSLFLDNLIRYHRILKQRNARLQSMYEQRINEISLISLYDVQLAELGTKIYEARTAFMDTFNLLFKKYYLLISDDREVVNLKYESQLNNQTLEKMLKDDFRRDLAAQHTCSGIHKDDIEFIIDGHPLKKFGSQGQQKSFLLALKFAQFDVIRAKKGLSPLLLLDDIFDRLDEDRIQRLMSIISGDEFGQVFVTDTSESRVRRIFNEIGSEISIFPVSDGQIKN